MDCTVLCYTISPYVKHHQEIIGGLVHSKEGASSFNIEAYKFTRKGAQEDD